MFKIQFFLILIWKIKSKHIKCKTSCKSTMGFYDTEEGVEEYIKHSEGWDGKQLIKILLQHLPESSTLLELGIGPGLDLDVLRKAYSVTFLQDMEADSITRPAGKYIAFHRHSRQDPMQQVRLLATDPGAMKDIEAFCAQTGNRLREAEQHGGEFVFLIEKG